MSKTKKRHLVRLRSSASGERPYKRTTMGAGVMSARNTDTDNMDRLMVFMLLSLFVSLFVSVFISIGNAATLNASDYLYANESASALTSSNYVVGGETYVLHLLAGSPILVEKNGNVVSDLDDIKEVIKYRCFATGYPSDSELDSVKSDILAFNESRNAQTSTFGGAETVCKFRLGQDKHPCYDEDTCRDACFSQYFCLLVYQAGPQVVLPLLLDFGKATNSFDNNVSFAVSTIEEMKSINSASQLTFDVVEKLNAISSAVNNMKSWAEKLQNSRLFEDNPDSINTCPPLGANSTKLSSAVIKLTSLSSKAGCFAEIDSVAQRVQNESLKRTDFYLNTKRKATLQNRYNNLSEQFNVLQDKALNLSSVYDDENLTSIPKEISDIGVKFYQDIAAKEYDQAGLDLSLYDEKLNELREYLDSVSVYTKALEGTRSSLAALIRKADVLIEPTDVLYGELTRIKSDVKKLDDELSEKRITYEQSTSYTEKYSSLKESTISLLNKKSQYEATRAQNAFAGIAREISLPVMEMISGPFGITEADKKTWMANIPLIILTIIDIVILAIAFLVFFFLVWRKKAVFLRPQILKTWAIIFAVLIFLLAGVTWAINSLIAKEAVQSSYFAFSSNVKKSTNVVIFADYSSLEIPTALKECSQKIASAFSRIGVNATEIDVVDGVCNNATFSDCLKEIGDTPRIRLSYASQNSTAFFTFYRTEAEMKGDVSYFNECILATLIGTENTNSNQNT